MNATDVPFPKGNPINPFGNRGFICTGFIDPSIEFKYHWVYSPGRALKRTLREKLSKQPRSARPPVGTRILDYEGYRDELAVLIDWSYESSAALTYGDAITFIRQLASYVDKTSYLTEHPFQITCSSQDKRPLLRVTVTQDPNFVEYFPHETRFSIDGYVWPGRPLLAADIRSAFKESCDRIGALKGEVPENYQQKIKKGGLVLTIVFTPEYGMTIPASELLVLVATVNEYFEKKGIWGEYCGNIEDQEFDLGVLRIRRRDPADDVSPAVAVV